MSNNYDIAKLTPFGSKNHISNTAIQVRSYVDYHRIILKWAEGKLDTTLIVVGSPGIGKSEAIKDALGSDPYYYANVQATPKGLFNDLWLHLDQPVVIDDVDELLRKPGVTGLLKAFLETKETKTLSWITDKSTRQSDGIEDIPSKFETTSRCVFLVNELKVLSANFQAVEDRAIILHFCPTIPEVHQYVGTWFDITKYHEVYEYIEDRLKFFITFSSRYYIKAAKLFDATEDWKGYIDSLLSVGHAKDLLALRLLTKYKDANGELTWNQLFKEWQAGTATTLKPSGDSLNAMYCRMRAIRKARGEVTPSQKAISDGMKNRWDIQGLN